MTYAHGHCILKIAVDIGAFSVGGHGISRYITELLPRMQRLAGAEVTWYLYGRHRTGWDELDGGRTVFRGDGLPEHAGRVASLFASLPAWAAHDRPDIYWAPAHRFPCWLPRSTRKVLTVHDLCWFKLPQVMRKVTYHLDRYFMPRSVRHADAVIAVSQSVADDLRELAPDVKNKVRVVHEGAMRIPPNLSRDELGIWGVRGPYMLFVGVQEPRKNLHRLLRALAVLESTGRLSADLLVVGVQGWGEVDLAAWIEQWGLGHRVRGHRPYVVFSQPGGRTGGPGAGGVPAFRLGEGGQRHAVGSDRHC